MLVLSRKKSETIIIDGRITIEVVQVKGKGVRLGINAPDNVRILRGELKPFGEESAEEHSNRIADFHSSPVPTTNVQASA